jgi:hypothetical protein
MGYGGFLCRCVLGVALLVGGKLMRLSHLRHDAGLPNARRSPDHGAQFNLMPNQTIQIVC